MTPVRRIYFIQTEDNWVEYFPTLKAMRERFNEHIKEGSEPDTGHYDYRATRDGVCRLLNMLRQDGD